MMIPSSSNPILRRVRAAFRTAFPLRACLSVAYMCFGPTFSVKESDQTRVRYAPTCNYEGKRWKKSEDGGAKLVKAFERKGEETRHETRVSSEGLQKKI
jgi:hypothetical protein